MNPSNDMREFKSGLSIVIPCLNESATIERAVRQALQAISALRLSGEVIVADNGSTDGSQELAQQAGARVLPVATRGYGSALHYGILDASYRWVSFADADLSYPLEDCEKLVQPLLRKEADFVLGTRLGGRIEPGAMPFLNRRLGTPFLSWLIRLLYNLRTTDCNSGMRALDRSLYEKLNLLCPGMEYASEMLIRVAQKNLRYQEVPIHFRKDRRGRPPHLSRWKDGWRHLRFIVANASSKLLILGPLLGWISLVGLAFLLSLQPLWSSHPDVHYHSAFVSLALSMPLLLFVISCILVKTALHSSGQVESALIRTIHQLSEKNYFFTTSILFFGLVCIETLRIFILWRANHWGALSEIAGVIRIMVYTILGSAIFCLDLGLGILKLIPYERSKR